MLKELPRKGNVTQCGDSLAFRDNEVGESGIYNFPEFLKMAHLMKYVILSNIIVEYNARSV